MGTQSSDAPDFRVTGARVEVDLTLALAPERLWDRVSDVTRIGEFSPECVGGSWLNGPAGPDGSDGPGGPGGSDDPGRARVGARFSGENRFANGNVGTVTCVVTVADRPYRFAWVVLDDAEDPDRPGSRWSYELTPGGSANETRVRHTFVHGPGDSGVRAAVRQHPEQVGAIVEGRLAQLRQHMTVTLRAMERA